MNTLVIKKNDSFTWKKQLVVSTADVLCFTINSPLQYLFSSIPFLILLKACNQDYCDYIKFQVSYSSIKISIGKFTLNLAKSIHLSMAGSNQL